MAGSTNGWDEYRLLVTEGLKQIRTEAYEDRRQRQAFERDVRQRLSDLHGTVAALKVKAGVWGAFGGLAISIGALLAILVRSWS